MSRPQLASDSATVVVKGHFNPAIFSPAWMLSQGLIGEADYLKAVVEVIVPDLAVFETGWLRCHVQGDTFQGLTTDETEFERLRDVAVGMLRTLSHTPISGLGINRQVHLQVDSREKYDAIGDALTQKDVWDNVLRLPGMKSVTIWGARPDMYAGRIQVQVEPSNVYRYGVYIAHNDHFELSKVKSQPTSREEMQIAPIAKVEPSAEKIPTAVEILNDEWAASMERAKAVIARVAKQAEA